MKAIIVDDESRVRRAIRLLVNWEAHGITEITEAEGGHQAMEMIRHRKPELVIMDMMMDTGNGIELMSWIGEFAGSVKFIVVSGHNDFEFVRNTVQHGGVDYILKPIDADAINAAVAKAVQSWSADELERQTQLRQNIQLNEFKPVYGEKLLSSLIHDTTNAEAAYRRLVRENVIPKQASEARLILLQMDPEDRPLLRRFSNDADLLYYTLTNVCNELIGGISAGISYKYWGAPDQILLLIWDLTIDMYKLLSQINDSLYHMLQRKVHFGVSTPGSLPSSLPQQYAEALSAMEQRNLLDTSLHIHAVNVNTKQQNVTHIYSFSQVREEWKVAILSGSKSQMQKCTEMWVEEFHKSGYISPRQLHQWKKDIIDFRTSLLQETLGSRGNDVLMLLEQQTQQISAPRADSYTVTLQVWREWSFELLCNLSHAILSRQSKDSHTFHDVVRYVEQHYDEELSLQQIADTFSISREYISRKFKQEHAINFTEYLTIYRLNKAKLLMLNPNLKINQIAEIVGIRDVKYFSKVFKKQEGISPKDYRNSLG